MSRTIRNALTKGWLDKLAAQRRTRKTLRELKADEVFIDWEETWVPATDI